MDNQLDLYGFQKWLKTHYGKQTQNDYLSKMNRLKKEGVTETTPPNEIANLVIGISEDKKGNETGRMYKKAIIAYCEFKKQTTGERPRMIDNFARIKYEERLPRNTEINPPKKGLHLYRLNAKFCDDDAIRLVLMVQLNSGLRIGEVLALLPEHIKMGKNSKGEDTVWLTVPPGKTTYGRPSRILRTDGMFDADEVYELMAKHLANGGIWPSSTKIYDFFRGMDKESDNPGGESHDLRKYCARALYREQRLLGKGKREAAEVVRKQLGHKEIEYTRGETKTNGGYIGKVYVEDKGKVYADDKIDWRTP